MAYDDRETGLTVEDRGSKLGLPQNQDAEANVLAAMLLSPEVVEEAQVELQPDDFYRPIHKTIYTAMVDMYNSRIPIDSISLIDYLRSINKLDAVGRRSVYFGVDGSDPVARQLAAPCRHRSPRFDAA